MPKNSSTLKSAPEVGAEHGDRKTVSESQGECPVLSKNWVTAAGTPGGNVISRQQTEQCPNQSPMVLEAIIDHQEAGK